MTNLTKSNQNGEQKGETIEPRPVLQSTDAALTQSLKSPLISDTSDITPHLSQTSQQITDNFQDIPNAARLIQALSAKLGNLAEWRLLTLKDGRQGWALFFPDTKWQKSEKGALVLK